MRDHLRLMIGLQSRVLVLMAFVPVVSLTWSSVALHRTSVGGLRLRGGAIDTPVHDLDSRLPAHLRSSLLATADTTFEHETALETRDGMSHMSMPQRLVWERSFANARQHGVSVTDAQELAIRSAVEGRIIEPDASMVGKGTVMCLTCQHEMPKSDRAILKAHFASDWHLFNLERQRAGIAPLSQAHFAERTDALLVEEQQRAQDVMCQGAQQHARTLLKRASRRASKLSSEIQKLLASSGAADESTRVKVRMLMDKKAACDREVQDLASAVNAASSSGVRASDAGKNAQADGSGGDVSNCARARGRPVGIGVSIRGKISNEENLVAEGSRAMTETKRQRAEREANRYLVRSASDIPMDTLRDGGQLVAHRCPFDGQLVRDLEANLEHMAAVHGFYIPFIADVSSVSDLVSYLVRKVYLGYVCIFCGSAFPSAESTQAHMQAKGHCKMVNPSDPTFVEEYGRYYAASVAAEDDAQDVQGTESDHDDLTVVGEHLQRLNVLPAATAGSRLAGAGKCTPSASADVQERVKAMLEARARRQNVHASQNPCVSSRPLPEGKTERDDRRDDGIEPDQEQEARDEMSARRQKLLLGAWAGPRTVAKKERLVGRAGAMRRDKRRAEMSAIQAAMLKYKQLGVARNGWRPSEAAKDALSASSQARTSGAHGTYTENRLTETNPLPKDLWFAKIPANLVVADKKETMMRHKQIKVAYKNYFTRKANGAGRKPASRGILNSGYRP